MRWYDLYIKSSEEQTLARAQQLGWSGLAVIGAELASPVLDISSGAEIEVTNPNTLRKVVQKLRSTIPLVAVKGTSPEISRAALETPEVDLLAIDWAQKPYFDQVMARLARKNNVAILFSFITLRHAYRAGRAELFSQYLAIARLVKKCRAPFVLSSGALSPWDLCAPQDLISFGRLLGFADPDIRYALSGAILTENRKRLSGNWIMPGIEIE